jgi:hypothetical protein
MPKGLAGEGCVMQIELRAFVPASLTPWVNAWRSSLGDWATSYRPEKHYMRGPGPKWREKHLEATDSTTQENIRSPMPVVSAH